MIKKVGSSYKVVSKTGKNLGGSKTRKGAEKRLKEVEYFKNRGNKKWTKKWLNF